MKKILFLIESLGGGGAEKVLIDIVKNIDKQKYDITVISVVDTGIYIEEIKKYCNYHSFLNNYNSFRSIYKIIYKIIYKLIYLLPSNLIYKIFIKDKYDIEIAFLEGFVTKIISNSNNKNSKKIAWVHIDPISRGYSDKYFKNLSEQKNSYKKYNHILCVSNSVATSFKKKFNINDNVSVQYNPVDSKSVINKSKEKTNLKKNNNLTLCTVGRLEKQKGYDSLLKVVKKLKQDNLMFELLILGEGKERENLRNYIKENNLNDCVKLLGFKKNPYKYMKKSDLFICSSRAEGFSLVIAEAMILGVPIISVNCSGPNELLNFGEYGILVKNNENALYEGIKQLITNRNLLDYYRKKSNERSYMFNIKQTIQEIQNLFN